MISICIPIYNCQVYNLGVSLVEQCFNAQIEFEIIFIDDFSSTECKKFNQALSDISNVVYIELDKNIGRAAIRNLFLKYARFSYLLFLDCDVKFSDNQFISRYVKALDNGFDVICGGRALGEKPDFKEKLLRWNYGLKRECLLSDRRNVNPYKSFLSNNFLIRKDIFESIKFDDRIKGYGHEDTLFGFMLRQNNVSIAHIDNPAVHQQIEEASEYIAKTEQAIENLIFIHLKIKPGSGFSQSVTLLKSYERLKMVFLRRFIAFIYNSTGSSIRNVLIKGKSKNLVLLDIYKIMYLCSISLTNKR